jgi:hypothetical protein
MQGSESKRQRFGLSEEKILFSHDAKNPLPGVPLCEQPFFSEYFDSERTDALTYGVARDLHDKGYALLQFPDDDFDCVAERVKSSLADRYDWQAWHQGKVEQLRIQDAWTWNDDVRRLAVNERILRLLGDLYGREALPFQTLNFGVGTQQHFHTDSVHFSSIPERFMCGVWLALEDIHIDAGPLIYYPGSHKWPIYVNEHVGHIHATQKSTDQSVYHTLWERLIEHHGIEPERLVVPKGSALIWAANLLHGGDHHRDRARSRWSQVSHYYFEGCSYYTPMLSDPALGSIAFREPVNMLTGKKLVNRYLGRTVDPEFIRNVNPQRLDLQLSDDFDPKGYLSLNPDVGVNPYEHYMRYGRYEARRWK